MSHPSIETIHYSLVPSAAQWFASLTPAEYSQWANELKKNLGKATLFNDVVFKHIFGEPGRSEEALKCFINAIREHLKQPPVVELTILHSTNFPIDINDKVTHLDIKARDETNTWYNIEVQRVHHLFFVARVVLYNCKIHGKQLEVGDDYSKIRPTISIIITDFVLFENLPDLCYRFQLTLDGDTSFVLTSDMQFYFLQLGRPLTETVLANLTPALADWVTLLYYPRTPEAMMETVLNSNEVIARSMMNLSTFVSNDRMRQLILDDTEKHRLDYLTDVNHAKAEGKAEGKAEIARELLNKGFSISEVVDVTKLSTEEVEGLARL